MDYKFTVQFSLCIARKYTQISPNKCFHLSTLAVGHFQVLSFAAEPDSSILLYSVFRKAQGRLCASPQYPLHILQVFMTTSPSLGHIGRSGFFSYSVALPGLLDFPLQLRFACRLHIEESIEDSIHLSTVAVIHSLSLSLLSDAPHCLLASMQHLEAESY